MAREPPPDSFRPVGDRLRPIIARGNGSGAGGIRTLTRTRGARLPRPWMPATSSAMPGSPIRRARKRPITLADGTVIALPKLTHPRAGLSHAQWRTLSPVEKIERQLGLSLDQMAEIISRPWDE